MLDDFGILGVLAGGMMIVMLIILGIIIVSLLLYVYKSLAFMYIGKNAKDSLAPLAWIPYVGNTIIAYRASGMHWWPWIFIGIYLLIMWPMMFFDSLIFSTIAILSGLVYAVFFIIWLWKLFEKVNWPGWLALLYIIPVVDLVVIGIVAWKKS